MNLIILNLPAELPPTEEGQITLPTTRGLKRVAVKIWCKIRPNIAYCQYFLTHKNSTWPFSQLNIATTKKFYYIEYLHITKYMFYNTFSHLSNLLHLMNFAKGDEKSSGNIVLS